MVPAWLFETGKKKYRSAVYITKGLVTEGYSLRRDTYTQSQHTVQDALSPVYYSQRVSLCEIKYLRRHSLQREIWGKHHSALYITEEKKSKQNKTKQNKKKKKRKLSTDCFSLRLCIWTKSPVSALFTKSLVPARLLTYLRPHDWERARYDENTARHFTSLKKNIEKISKKYPQTVSPCSFIRV